MTDVTFSAPGIYVLTLTADDSELQGSDDVTRDGERREHHPAGHPGHGEHRRRGGGGIGQGQPDQWRPRAGPGRHAQTVGLRFQGVSMPQGATILSAYVQFRADEKSSTVATLTIEGQAADAAPTFTGTAFGISSRPRTVADATWTPDPWTLIGESGPKQRTTDLSSVLQEIVNRAGWAGGALVLIVTGDGVGKRTAESFNAGASLAPVLHVEFATA